MAKQLPLKNLHTEAGARFGLFAGYDMPITYPLGVMKEHLHTREAAGLFDISHMAHLEVRGPQAADLVARACPYASAAQGCRTGRYTFMLNENAGMIDDLIVSRLESDRYLVVANGACAEKDLAHLELLAEDFDAQVTQIPRVFLALQGPKAAATLGKIFPEVVKLLFMQVKELDDGTFISRSGYTGEDGFEIALSLEAAEPFARQLADMPDVEWIGLGARDSLRIEAGLPLYGQDMDEETDPVTAGLIWAVPKDLRNGGTYLGADALREVVSNGASQKRIGLKPDGRAPVRAGSHLYAGEETEAAAVGIVTSGGFGPSCGHPVAIARIHSDHGTVGDRVFAEVRGKRLACSVEKMPFVAHNYYRGEQ
ncbi:glycine cleavage system aminomethyltransferase GcvT [Hoeflea prorocentri]|uniref:aminomethyltransferase n=2 Tax=Hoeflea prorocentri TaxID=1922333 RepID=A0A9X3UL30_9HYPH|nr:glycine cleavage system aminomethyltransferase GcvT [Hoeflea prorocentri]MCY6380931.1 glycine cleavage system aminomethyltransferase GcvT [Hoeflea prorocentri]MDA5398731.1 glycine cleavage system aminomethyltransferase GcvT [Hoeflea prorocentri]